MNILVDVYGLPAGASKLDQLEQGIRLALQDAVELSTENIFVSLRPCANGNSRPSVIMVLITASDAYPDESVELSIAQAVCHWVSSWQPQITTIKLTVSVLHNPITAYLPDGSLIDDDA